MSPWEKGDDRMEAVIVDDNHAEDWDAYVVAHPDAIAWQSYAWHDVLRKHYPVTFYPIAVFERARLCGVLPLYRVRTRLKKSALISVPYVVAGGIAADGNPLPDFLAGREISKSSSRCIRKFLDAL